MKLPRRTFLRLAVGAAVLPAVSRIAWAQAFPTRPVRVIVPFAPGGPTDIFARLITPKLSDALGKQFYVENIAGASGNIGTGQVARATPDGHTLLMNVNSFVINPSFFDKVPYDPYKDFEPISLAVRSTTLLSVNPSVPAKTIQDLVSLIRANPGKYNFSSGGVATQAHLTGELFRLSLGLDLVHVPYNGGGPSVASTVAGHTPILFSPPAQAIPYVTAGSLRALAVTSKMRAQILPDVPTMAESGYPDVEGDQWVGVFAPAGTAKEIVATLNREIVKAIAQPTMKERLATLGFEPVGSTASEFAAQIRTDTAKWAKVIRAANIKAE
jgi:tripartite-type tricarboxylate transporter receptor subunit TctC